MRVMSRRIIFESQTQAQLQAVVDDCVTIKQVVIRLMGNARYYTPVMKRLAELGVSTEKVRVTTARNRPAIMIEATKKGREAFKENRRLALVSRLSEIFSENSEFSGAAVRSLIHTWNPEFGWLEYKCQECDNPGYYNGKKLQLQVDHKNGNNRDNRFENLRFLCPNCHAQTETYTGRNMKKAVAKRLVAKTGLEPVTDDL
jgi:5-methylcytosine-specific restriction endonuclease McrA